MRKEDWEALKELKNDESIIIKEADKGRAIVLMDSAHNEQMIYKQLEVKKADPSCDKKTNDGKQCIH